MTAAMTMERCLSELGADPDLLDERRREELSSKGFALFTGIIDPTWLELLRTRFEELIAAEGERAGLEVHQEEGTRRLADLVNKGRAFDRVWSHPVLLAAARRFGSPPSTPATLCLARAGRRCTRTRGPIAAPPR